VEADADRAVTAEKDETSEGLSHHVGHTSETPDLALVEAATVALTPARISSKATSEGASGHSVQADYALSGSTVLGALGDLQRGVGTGILTTN